MVENKAVPANVIKFLESANAIGNQNNLRVTVQMDASKLQEKKPHMSIQLSSYMKDEPFSYDDKIKNALRESARQNSIEIDSIDS